MRVLFLAALIVGVAMIAASVHGIVGIDRQLEHSAQAAQRMSAPHVIRVRGGDCPQHTTRI